MSAENRPRAPGSGSVRPIVVVVLLAAIVATGCAAGPSPRSTSPASPAVNATDVPLLPRDVYALPTFDFERYRALIAQLKGTPVVVNIWASWCGPCVAEAPELASAAKKYAGTVQFLGVDILDERAAAVGFIREHGVPYPSVFDASGEIRDRLGFVGQPDTLFYDRSGRIAATSSGPLTGAALTANLVKIAARG